MAPLMNSMMPSSSSLTRKNIERDLKAPVIASISFFILHNCMQKLAGLLSIHSGRNPLLKLTYGFVSFSCCSVASYMAAKELSSSITNKYKIPFVLENIQKPWTNNKNKRELIRKFYVGLGLFLLIEGKAFHTALPSNILSIGVFANTKLGSVPATSDVATELQRRTIQTLGHTYGCHQCGNRQMISRVKLFIADHQPPTKIAIQIRESFLSRLTNFKVSYTIMVLHYLICLLS